MRALLSASLRGFPSRQQEAAYLAAKSAALATHADLQVGVQWGGAVQTTRQPALK